MESPGYDLIIAGAGPAGSACAITAARAGARVLLLEKDRFPRHKVCGEFVSPESLRLLEWLLGTNSFQSRPEISRARIFFGKKMTYLPVSPPARSIPRFSLDDELLRAARNSGVEVRDAVTVREVQQAQPFKVVTADQTYSSRAVVNASGRWSQLSHQSPDAQKWIGLKAHFHEAGPSPTVDLYFFDGGYCGVQPVEADTVNACAMVRAERARSLQEVFALHPELQQRSRSWQAVFEPITTSPLFFRPPQTTYKGMLLAGDAAAFIDPFAGDGISLALQSGSLAAELLTPLFQGHASLEEIHRRYHSAYGKQFAPAFRNAARIRRALSAPKLIRSLLLSLAGTKPIARALVSSTRAR